MEDYVTFEQAVKLKELGFDWKCLYWYHPNEDDKTKRFRMANAMNHNFHKIAISAPTINQAQKWLREVKEIEVGVFGDFDGELPTGKWVWLMRKFNAHLFDTVFTEDDIRFNTYEEALIDGIDKAIELLKQDNNEQ